MKIILFFMSGGDHGDRSGDRKNRHYPQTWKPKGFRYTQTSPRVIARIRRLAETKQSRWVIHMPSGIALRRLGGSR